MLQTQTRARQGEVRWKSGSCDIDEVEGHGVAQVERRAAVDEPPLRDLELADVTEFPVPRDADFT